MEKHLLFYLEFTVPGQLDMVRSFLNGIRVSYINGHKITRKNDGQNHETLNGRDTANPHLELHPLQKWKQMDIFTY